MLPPDQAKDLEALVRDHQVGLWRYLRALGADAQLANDLLQDSFLVAFEKLDDRSDDVRVATYLRRTARHLYLRHRRDESRHARLLADAVERQWCEHGADDGGDDWLAALRACVAGLEGRASEVVSRFYRDGESRRHIAAQFGMRENGVKTLLQRTRQVLRECIERRLPTRSEDSRS